MKVERVLISNEELIEALAFPKDSTILGIKRNPNTLEFEIDVKSHYCEEKAQGGALLCETYKCFINEALKKAYE